MLKLPPVPQETGPWVQSPLNSSISHPGASLSDFPQAPPTQPVQTDSSSSSDGLLLPPQPTGTWSSVSLTLPLPSSLPPTALGQALVFSFLAGSPLSTSLKPLRGDHRSFLNWKPGLKNPQPQFKIHHALPSAHRITAFGRGASSFLLQPGLPCSSWPLCPSGGEQLPKWAWLSLASALSHRVLECSNCLECLLNCSFFKIRLESPPLGKRP